ncbi:uncharacterized protein M421DRAFT_383869 [Didymella exigua CBS 183.55]|uniref:Uncharacterized protein n=1 Tax=Didymella exigua CBS 183.55 TaxID=1150837 RepID=A0A6A5RNV1_9PLEO|nr:uncharacterized protein M421DRAFT_383869 [Didymella exigua CBS 183.55]KAF1930065.1 hypothetical protein M421DRAFT_383869 [Didymella exigua CBS 183.55]
MLHLHPCRCSKLDPGLHLRHTCPADAGPARSCQLLHVRTLTRPHNTPATNSTSALSPQVHQLASLCLVAPERTAPMAKGKGAGGGENLGSKKAQGQARKRRGRRKGRRSRAQEGRESRPARRRRSLAALQAQGRRCKES